MSTDAIELSHAVVHNSPPDIGSWPATTRIEGLTMRPGQNNGLAFTFAANQTWPDYVPPGWTGPIQYTVWAGAQINGTWHIAGFIQMWRSRPSTGAPILAQWGDWAYDRNRWGDLVDYRPRAGDQMIFFLSAGNARKGSAGPEPDVTSVRERSNVVMITLPAGDDGVFMFAPAPAPVSAARPVVEPVVAAPPPAGSAPGVDLDAIMAEIQKLSAQMDALTDAVKAMKPAPKPTPAPKKNSK